MRLYNVILSNKTSVKIDEVDFQKLQSGIGSGNLIRFKQAIINPSFIVAILPIFEKEKTQIEGYEDKERGVFVVTVEKKEEILEDLFNLTETKRLNENNRQSN